METTQILIASQPNTNIEALIKRMKEPLTDPYKIVETIEQYEALENKYKFDLLIVNFGGIFVQTVLND